jgi:hypothetical protein
LDRSPPAWQNTCAQDELVQLFDRVLNYGSGDYRTGIGQVAFGFVLAAIILLALVPTMATGVF